MKKIILGAAAATLIASPILAAAPANAADRHGRTEMRANQNGRHEQNRAATYRAPNRTQSHTAYRTQSHTAYRTQSRTTYRAPQRVTYGQTYRPTYRTWNRGDRFDSRYASNYRVVSNYRDYDLQAPPYGYQWEQSGNDAVLVALAGGLIGAVIGGALN